MSRMCTTPKSSRVGCCEAQDSPLEVRFWDVTRHEHVSEQGHGACIRALDEAPALQCNILLCTILATVNHQDAKVISLQYMH